MRICTLFAYLVVTKQNRKKQHTNTKAYFYNIVHSNETSWLIK